MSRSARRSMSRRARRRWVASKRDQLLELRDRSPETIAAIMGLDVEEVRELLVLLAADEAAMAERVAS